MKLLRAFLKLIRYPNLAIVAITQYLLQYLVLVPAIKGAGHLPLLGDYHFFLLVLTTVLIAAGGYIINDILDYEADIVNKPSTVFINTYFPIKKALALYGGVTATGFAIAWYLAAYVQNLSLVLIYPSAVLLLYLYSKTWKKQAIIGNIVVSLYCAMVAGIVLYAERERFGYLDWGRGELGVLITSYLVFAFLSTWFREIIKDLEDLEGDAKLGLRTLPLRFGVKSAKLTAMVVGGILLILLMVFLHYCWQSHLWFPLGFGLLTLVPLLVYSIAIVPKAQIKKHYSRISLLLKILMLVGLVLLVLANFSGEAP